MTKTEVLIVGGGVAGLSTAYFLGKSGMRSVIVLEQEQSLGGHASGRNAGMLRQAVPDPVLASLARDSRQYFEKLAGNGWGGLSLKRQGSLLLAKRGDAAELDAIERTLARAGVSTRRLKRQDAESMVPLLRGGDFDHALFCPSDAMIDLEPLMKGFTKSLRTMGIRVITGAALEDVQSKENGFLVKAGNREFFVSKLVNAAGAWASWVAEKARARKLPLKAYRRHLFDSLSKVPASHAWPFVWDMSHDFYFRPTPKGLLLSPCDKTLESKGDRREKTDPRMKILLMKKLQSFRGGLGRTALGRSRSGLRTMAPDGRFVVGKDPVRKDFFWVAGLGGHGVTTCFSVGRLAADMILGNKTDKKMERALSPGRFSRS